MSVSSEDPHRDVPLVTSGEALEHARVAVILIHGRGGLAQEIMKLTRYLPAERVCYLAPQAANQEWYPLRFLAPTADNEPGLSSALGLLRRLMESAAKAGIPRERILLGGFSQGGCLALETAARLGGKFGGIFALSGAVIGPPGAPRPHDLPLDGTPIFNACGDADAHIPLASVRESTRILSALGARVNERIYRGLGHVIVSDETTQVNTMIEAALAS